MKALRAVISTLALAVFGMALGTPAGAHSVKDVHRKMIVTTTHPLEIPGTVLPAGKYMFKVLDVVGSRNVVQVTNEDGTKPIAMFNAIMNYRAKATVDPLLEYHNRPAGSPPAVKGWFFGREKAGLEFVYPKQKAVELAKASDEIVPAETTEPAQITVRTLRTVVLIAITPEGKEEPVAAALQPLPIDQPMEPVEVAQTLPQTASSTPLIAMSGAMFMMVGFGLKQLARQRS